MKSVTRLLFAALMSTAAAGSSQAATYDGDGYNLTYSASAAFGGFLTSAQGADRRFLWSGSSGLDQVAAMVTPNLTFDLRTIALPSFSVTADPGYQLSGLFISFDGKVYGSSSTPDKPLLADAFLFSQRLRIDGSASKLTGTTNWTVISNGTVQRYWDLTTTAPGNKPFSTFSFGGDIALVLDGTQAGNQFFIVNTLGSPQPDAWPMQVRFKVDRIELGPLDPSGTVAVPEPATWASLLLGLALVGGRLRRRTAPHPGRCARPGRIAAAALLTGLAGAPLTGQAGVVCPVTENLARGVDVSAFNGNIDWGSVAGAGISFGVAKAVEGTGFVDPSFARNWAGMGSAGLVKAAYASFRADQDPLAQAQLYLSTVGDFGSGTLPPILAVLTTDGQPAYKLLSRVDTWLSTVQAATGRTPVVLTSAAVWGNLLGSSSNFGASLWIAHWGAQCPTVPSAWPDWQLWQNTDRGSVAGIQGFASLDAFNGTTEQLQHYALMPSVPEPGTWATMLAGLAMLWGARRRRA